MHRVERLRRQQSTFTYIFCLGLDYIASVLAEKFNYSRLLPKFKIRLFSEREY
jgi:hypothetical protein